MAKLPQVINTYILEVAHHVACRLITTGTIEKSEATGVVKEIRKYLSGDNPNQGPSDWGKTLREMVASDARGHNSAGWNELYRQNISIYDMATSRPWNG